MFAKIAVIASFIGLVRSGALSNPALNGLGAYGGGYDGYSGYGGYAGYGGYGSYGGYGAGHPGLTPGGVATSYVSFNKYSGPHVPYNGAYADDYGFSGPYIRAGLAGLSYPGAGLPYAGASNVLNNGLRGVHGLGAYGPAGLPYGNALGYPGYGNGIGAYGNNAW